MATAVRSYSANHRTMWIIRMLVVAGVLIVVGFFGYILVRTIGRVEGVEFSPDSFDRRTFRYWELPLVRWRITKAYYEPETGSLEQWLKMDKKLLPASSMQPERWHLVRMARGGRRYRDDAEIVVRFLDAEPFSATKPYWQQWSEDHPKLAPILWPEVVELCRQERYQFVPDLFDVAEQMTVPHDAKPSAEEFRAAINESLARQTTKLADIRREQGRIEEAIELYDQALSYDKDFADAVRGREKAQGPHGQQAPDGD